MTIVPLRPGGAIPAVVAEPDAKLIADLETLLADARSGHLRAIGYTTVDRDRALHTNWCGHCDLHDILAGANILNYRLMRNANMDGDET